MKKQWAFTLVEMLVVIAIIGILAALMLPSLKNAINTAHGLKCQNNMKQIGIGFHQYVSDNKGFMPPNATVFSSITYAGATRSNPWLAWWSAITFGEYVNNTTVGSTAFSPYQQKANSDILYCDVGYALINNPSSRSTCIGYNSLDWPFNRFTSNIDYRWSTPGIPKTYKSIYRAKNASKVLVLADVPSGSSFRNIRITDNKISYPHNDMSNILILDNHVESSFDLEGDSSSGEISVKLNF